MNEIQMKIDIPTDDQINVFGAFDRNVKLLEKQLDVKFSIRGDNVIVSGSESSVSRTKVILSELLELSRRGTEITAQKVEYALSIETELTGHPMVNMDGDVVCHTISGKPIKPKTLGQKKYLDSIRSKMITFGIGPAGTGKTYLAMAMAIKAFQKDEVKRIILTRPAIEAGEKLGFLPGDLQSKVDPYLRPLYDALYQIMGADSFAKNMERGLIEVAPLAYMRGRTLDDAFIILDEAQNTTQAQMKMFLTRIGFGSKAVITGDDTQKDLPKDVTSGLDVAKKVLEKVDDIGFIQLTGKDVVRHPLVQKIVKAYESYERRQQTKQSKSAKERRRK